MSERTYTFEFVCPRCGKDGVANGTREEPPPKANCGDCLFNDTEIAEMIPTRVWVNDGASKMVRS